MRAKLVRLCGPQRYMKNTKSTKIQNLQNLQKLQNLNYGIYINNKIQVCFFFLRFVDFVLENCPKCSQFRKCFGIVGVFCIVNRYFEYRIRIRCI